MTTIASTPIPALTPAHRTPPRLRGVDHTLALLADPYRFIGRRADALATDAFEARLLLRPTVCLRGPRWAERFYDDSCFQRSGAAPEFLRSTLFGHGGVQTLDGAAHRWRKAWFLDATAADRVTELVERVRAEWCRDLPAWRSVPAVNLYRAVQPVLTRAVCAWAGVPLPDADVARRSRQLTALFDSAASGPFRHLRSRIARWQAEHWLSGLIRAIRDGSSAAHPGRAAHSIAWHRDERGALLKPRIAAVELLNLLRPTVAASVYIAFTAHALQAHPAWQARMEEDAAGTNDRSRQAFSFAQEVRRHYPFFPAVTAVARRAFDFDGLHLTAGRRVLLDLYGTNHDPRAWPEPDRFRPERWQRQTPGRFDFVPQGGGDAAVHHRCPGEDVTTRLIVLAIEMLTRRMRFMALPANLSIDMTRLPALPGGGYELRGLQAAG